MPSVNVKGVRLNYVEQGTGDEVIVFVHGWLSSLGAWKETWALLSPTYHAYALDLRGCGQSDRVKEGCTVAQFAEDVHNFSQELGLGRFTYVGHSMGGPIGIRLALDHPEVLKALVLVAPVPAHGLKIPDEQLPVVRGGAGNEEFMHIFLPMLFATLPSDERVEELLKDMLSVEKEAFLDSLDSFMFFDVESRLGEIKVPTMMVIGEKDMVTLPDEQRRTAKGIAGCRLEVFADNGHYLQIESPDRFVDVLTGFIEEVNRGPA